jgi:vancomycin resistance protein VanW
MMNKYFPYEYCKSVFDIDYEKLYQLGYKAIIFDIDNTLVHHGENATPQIEQLFIKLHDMGFKTILITDNDLERTLRFVKNINTSYICDAEKPNIDAYLKALELLKVNKNEVVVIGDQIFKDILGANNSSLASIMVKFITIQNEKWLGWRRYMEYIFLFLWRFSRFKNRLGGISLTKKYSFFQIVKLLLRHELLFCDINNTCYKISSIKEITKRNIYNFTHNENYLKRKVEYLLANKIYSCQSYLIKHGDGIDPEAQYNKAINIAIASEKINGVVISPGEVFSFWKIVGSTTKRKGYKEGRIIERGRLITGIGGGLCNLVNILHILALNSPLDVTEVHYHSDALAFDHGERIPMSSGTSVNYNNIDLRFKNNTNQDFQIIVNVKENTLFAEIRSDFDVPYTYDISEEDHHFRKENNKYYRISKIYRDTIDKLSGNIIRHDLIRNNHSEVMYDYSLIPKEIIRG